MTDAMPSRIPVSGGASPTIPAMPHTIGDFRRVASSGRQLGRRLSGAREHQGHAARAPAILPRADGL